MTAGRVAALMLLVLLAAGTVIAVPAAVLWSSMNADSRTHLLAALDGQEGLIVVLGGFLVAAAFGGARMLAGALSALPRLGEDAASLAESQTEGTIARRGPRELRALAGRVEDLARRLQRARAEIASIAADARRAAERDAERIATVLADLAEGIVACAADGRILLYNERARIILAGGPVHGQRHLLGVGKSIFAVLDRSVVAHALERLSAARGRGIPHPVASFVTTLPDGALIRTWFRPLPTMVETEAEGLLIRVSEFSSQRSSGDAIATAVESSRSPLANARAAIENLAAVPDMPEATRAAFVRVAQEEITRLVGICGGIGELVAVAQSGVHALEPMLATDLVAAICATIDGAGSVRALAAETDPAIEVMADSLSLVQATATLAIRITKALDVPDIGVRLAAPGNAVHLDLVWRGRPVGVGALDAMLQEAAGAHAAPEVTLKRHGAGCWPGTEPATGYRFVRLALTRSVAGAPAAERNARGAPQFDFGLLQAPTSAALPLLQRPLADLTYTVFDTETTGLDPTGGDEIISIAAVRIVRGRIVRNESFEQLADPGRSVPPASTRIHGITDDMLSGQPPVRDALTAFHAYCRDTVLVAHNAAFDMRFLEMKEPVTGLRFDQPVLDTLALSAVAQPNQDSHGLEQIAERFGIEVIGRHTALGDAIVTAEVFLRMLELLRSAGLRTLGEALAAAESTEYAKLRY
jgi:DNA polymerase-3 subunit epsilon